MILSIVPVIYGEDYGRMMAKAGNGSSFKGGYMIQHAFHSRQETAELEYKVFFSHMRSVEQAVSTLVNSTALWSQGSRLGCVFVCSVTQLCLTLCNPIHCSPPGFSVHGLLQARVLEWVAFSSSRGSSQPRDQTHISCIGRWILYCWATWEAPE